MDFFKIHNGVMDNYKTFIESFINIADEDIKNEVASELTSGKLWPDPLIQFNPSFEECSDINSLVECGVLHSSIRDIFSGYRLYRHQVEAIKLGILNKDFVVTSGTGSGKSLTYIGTIFNHILNNPNESNGIKAIIVYPMNALINSQTQELNKYEENYNKLTGKSLPITHAQYTGQEREARRKEIVENPPNILLTNYMMLELLLSRVKERRIRDSIYSSLRFLVFDELHTYRGRQGADVSLLIRRIQAQCQNEITYIGTSATMVSGVSIEDQKKKVAEVASIIFGKKFKADQIVQETLARCFDYSNGIPSKEVLAKAVSGDIDIEQPLDKLMKFPTAVWLENKIALKEYNGCLIRNKPLCFADIANALVEDTGIERHVCETHLNALTRWIANVNIKHIESPYTYLPFRLHQFVSQTGSVYATLDQDENREITLEPSPFRIQENKRKPLFPNVFSRISGHPFICVTLNYETNLLEPREFSDFSDETEDVLNDGYLIVGSNVWNPKDDLEQLPESWLKINSKGEIVGTQKQYIKRIPQKIYYDEEGKFSFDEPMRFTAWYMPTRLLFDPTSGAFFDAKTSESTKLARLGSEGRSSSTTILSLSLLQQLARAGMGYADQKLLSFTDNRQDAALQAGHFNDFLDTIQLRAAIYRALLRSQGNTLNYKNLGQEIFEALNLDILEYANTDTTPPLWKITKYQDAFKKYLVYRTLYDLRRGWRVTLPNLEQCALLDIDYEHLDDVASSDNLWQDVMLLNSLSKNDRKAFIFQVLEFFRHSYAIYSETYLIPRVIDENHKEIIENLKDPWNVRLQQK